MQRAELLDGECGDQIAVASGVHCVVLRTGAEEHGSGRGGQVGGAGVSSGLAAESCGGCLLGAPQEQRPFRAQRPARGATRSGAGRTRVSVTTRPAHPR